MTQSCYQLPARLVIVPEAIASSALRLFRVFSARESGLRPHLDQGNGKCQSDRNQVNAVDENGARLQLTALLLASWKSRLKLPLGAFAIITNASENSNWLKHSSRSRKCRRDRALSLSRKCPSTAPWPFWTSFEQPKPAPPLQVCDFP